MATNAASRTPAPPSSATIWALSQPSSLPRSSARISRNRPPVSVSRPPKSTRRAIASLDSDDVGAGDRQAGEAERDVDEEDPAPAQAAGQRAADERADGEGGADRGAVGGQRTAALLGARERVGQQRERDGEHDRAADALHRTGGVEEGDVAGHGAEQRRDGEERQAIGEQAAAAEAVGQRAGGEHGRGEGEGVGVDDPLQAVEVGVEVTGDLGERGVDDGDVEHEHRGGGTDHGERPALGLGHERSPWGAGSCIATLTLTARSPEGNEGNPCQGVRVVGRTRRGAANRSTALRQSSSDHIPTSTRQRPGRCQREPWRQSTQRTARPGRKASTPSLPNPSQAPLTNWPSSRSWTPRCSVSSRSAMTTSPRRPTWSMPWSRTRPSPRTSCASRTRRRVRIRSAPRRSVRPSCSSAGARCAGSRWRPPPSASWSAPRATAARRAVSCIFTRSRSPSAPRARPRRHESRATPSTSPACCTTSASSCSPRSSARRPATPWRASSPPAPSASWPSASASASTTPSAARCWPSAGACPPRSRRSSPGTTVARPASAPRTPTSPACSWPTTSPGCSTASRPTTRCSRSRSIG